jgi:cytochrome c oxidase cbb3-type subunit 3
MSPQKQDRLLDHDFDGIQEFDNPMPRWWVYIFWATIAFSAVYALNVGPVGSGAGRIADYEAEMASFRAAHPEPQGEQVDAAALAALAQDQDARKAGKAVYDQNCAACHRPDGGGMIGPNLTDDHWLHGGTLAEIHRTVHDGVLAKGMPAWGKILKPEQLNAVVAYVASLHGTNPPNPKAPEGTPAAAP